MEGLKKRYSSKRDCALLEVRLTLKLHFLRWGWPWLLFLTNSPSEAFFDAILARGKRRSDSWRAFTMLASVPWRGFAKRFLTRFLRCWRRSLDAILRSDSWRDFCDVDVGKLSEAADETIESFSQQMLTFLDLPFRLWSPILDPLRSRVLAGLFGASKVAKWLPLGSQIFSGSPGTSSCRLRHVRW